MYIASFGLINLHVHIIYLYAVFTRPSQRNINATTFALHESHCSRHIVYCVECEEGVPKSGFDEHVQECHAPSACPKCGESVKKHLLDDHKVRGHDFCTQSV